MANMDKYEYRRDSSDNVHVVYQAPNFNNKAFEQYVPPRYTEKGLAPVPIPPAPPVAPAPVERRKILGVRRSVFFIVLAIFLFLVLAVAVGAGVGVAAATKRHRVSPPPPNGTPDSNFVQSTSTGPVTVTLTPSPTTFTTSVVPTSTPVPTTHCQQMWEGTAPFCDGHCDGGWTVVKQQALADDCDESTDTVIIDSCANLSGNSCWSGNKVLCQKCEVEDPAT